MKLLNIKLLPVAYPHHNADSASPIETLIIYLS